MNRSKVVIQCLMFLTPLMASVILPLDLLWGLITFFGGNDVSDLKNTVSEFIPSTRLVSLLLGFILSIIILFILRRINKDKRFNRGSDYFDYSINYYFIASKILGYGKVTLVKVPLYLQFKLLIKEMFDCIIPDNHTEKTDEPKVITCDMDYKSDEVNLILSDTYLIDSVDLPSEKSSLPAVIIERTAGFSGNRTYNPKFIATIRAETNKYRLKYKRVNIFATTNTQHTKEIITQCFNNGGRTGFDEIYVYEQTKIGNDYPFNKAHQIQ